MNSANDKYGSSLDRTLGAGKPVDPATRLSELLAQSLEELTRPFDPPRQAPAAQPARQPITPPGEVTAAQPLSPEAAAHDLLPREEPSEPTAEETRIDADKALAELEAELFAAARQVDGDASIAHPADETDAQRGAEASAEPGDHAPQGQTAEPAEALPASHDDETREKEEASLASLVPSPAPAGAVSDAEPVPNADSERLVRRVRKLMLVSMAITVIGVGSVFGVIGWRIFKNEGTTAKTADKLPPASAIPTDMTLALPRGARVVQSAVANDRLLITIDIDGKLEVRTFDVKTLQPAGRLNFTATP
jgi:hypothetical protein